MDTIFALASAPGRAGVAIVRVSGPDAWDVCRALTGDVPAPRHASLRRLRYDGEVLDEALVLTFASGQSFTGEQSVEFQTHGSTAVVARLHSALATLPNVRAAEAGEFTRRALENERLDLSQVEGLADLINAETEAQRRQALQTFDGVLGRQTENWRSRLLRAAALVEASIDFADEDVPEDVLPEVGIILCGLIEEFHKEIAGSDVAESVRHGFEVAIVGPPNIGKSTLINALAGREAAITSEIAGTTRDVIEVRMDVGGIPATFLDTAGLRETEDKIESIGIERARGRADRADMRLFLGDEDLGVIRRDGDVLISPKSDIARSENGLPVSGLTGDGIDALLLRIEKTLSERIATVHSTTRVRHAQALCRAVTALETARDRVEMYDESSELIAEEIRDSIRAIDSLVGRIGVEDILGEIFSSFCIGK